MRRSQVQTCYETWISRMVLKVHVSMVLCAFQEGFMTHWNQFNANVCHLFWCKIRHMSFLKVVLFLFVSFSELSNFIWNQHPAWTAVYNHIVILFIATLAVEEAYYHYVGKRKRSKERSWAHYWNNLEALFKNKMESHTNTKSK